MTGAGDEICKLLSEAHIPHEEVEEHSNHIDRLVEVGEQLVEITGADDENIYRDVRYDVPEPLTAESGWGEIEVDIVTASTPAHAPHVAIYTTIDSEFDGMARYSEGLSYTNQLLLGSCGSSSGANIAVLLSNEYIAVSIAPSEESGSHDLEICSFEETKDQFCTELSEWLSPPESYPTRDPGPLPSTIETWRNSVPNYKRDQYPDLFETASTDGESSGGTGPDQSEIGDYSSVNRLPSEISTQHYELDLEQYRAKLESVEKAETPARKGESLEEFASLLFSGLNMVEVREKNLRTKTGEIDLVLEHTGSGDRTLFDSYTRFVLVECKNRKGRTPAEEIRKLQNRMAEVDSDLGFFVTTSQLTGYQTDTDASRLANKYTSTPRIVTISPDEIEQISTGASLYEIIDEKLFRQRFDSY